jgi:cytochrome c oxidase subunit 1
MADAAIHHDHHDERGFFTRWFMSTNHKDIGILYLIVSGIAGFIAVAFTVYMRMELSHPGVQFMCLEGARLWPGLGPGDLHAQRPPLERPHHLSRGADDVLRGDPALFGGFGNYLMPLQIGAPDMAFPRLNNLSFWMFVAGLSLGVASMLAPGGDGQLGAGVGWVSTRRSRPRTAAWRWTSRSSRCTCRAPPRSWAPST